MIWLDSLLLSPNIEVRHGPYHHSYRAGAGFDGTGIVEVADDPRDLPRGSVSDNSHASRLPVYLVLLLALVVGQMGNRRCSDGFLMLFRSRDSASQLLAWVKLTLVA